MDSKDTSSSGEENGKIEGPSNSQSHEQPVPTIITYPEFLLRPQRAPPLLTPGRVLDTLYVAGGIMGAIYATSRYIVQPMIESLTEARLSLAGTALANLKNLNSQLEDTVSEVPASVKQMSSDEVHGDGGDDEQHSETSSAVSDPTELFHVDVGTQTSPIISRPLSPSNGILTSSSSADDRLAKLAHHESRLKDLHSHLSEIVEVTNDVGDADADVAASVHDLSAYLDSLIDSSPYYRSNYKYDAWLGADGGLNNNRGQRNMISEDAVTKVKAEIRGIKGVFLSARHFPSLGR